MAAGLAFQNDSCHQNLMRYYVSATIIVAATTAMGMSYLTHLPWPKLPRENAYFETTTRLTTSSEMMNAVVMGYNTWDDEPTKLFGGRINVVVTRQREKVLERLERGRDGREGRLLVVGSLDEAVETLERMYSNVDDESVDEGKKERPRLGRIFIIGGAELCRSALRLPWVDRLLLTRVAGAFKADTFFPHVLDGVGNEEWCRKSDEEFREWGGAHVPVGVQDENGIEWEALMFERRM